MATLPDVHEAIQQINHRIQNIEEQIQIGQAQTANVRIISRNTRLQYPYVYQPLQKTVPGYGRELALTFTNVLDEADQQVFHAEFPPNGNASSIGSTPLNFEPNHYGYSHLDILRLMVFYNDSFDIAPQDDLVDRKCKFRIFLTEF